MNSITSICIMILQNPPGNNVVSLIPIKYFLVCQICKINYFIKNKKLTELNNNKKLFMYILTLNFLNYASIIGFHSRFLKT